LGLGAREVLVGLVGEEEVLLDLELDPVQEDVP
jgi:hypothetical protein